MKSGIIYFYVLYPVVFTIWNDGTVNTTYVNKSNSGKCCHICFYLLTTCFDLSRCHHQVIPHYKTCGLIQYEAVVVIHPSRKHRCPKDDKTIHSADCHTQ
jgi:hypothetical protein